MLVELLERLQRKDRRALSRLLTLLGHGEQTGLILSKLPAPAQPAQVVTLTGAAGVGKSSLVGKLIEATRRHEQTIAVLACDPQSPLSGGALLGDRFRMSSRPEDEGIFIRSLATPGGHGAIAEHLDSMIRLLEAFGFDLIVVETVGAGQGDTTVQRLVDGVVLLLQPETGDDLQWEKAGVLEIADLIVIHKADLPGAQQVEAQVLSMLSLSTRPAPPILAVSSRTNQGVETLYQAIRSLPPRRQSEHEERTLLRLTQETLAARWSQARGPQREQLEDVVQRWQRRELSTESATQALLEILAHQSC